MTQRLSAALLLAVVAALSSTRYAAASAGEARSVLLGDEASRGVFRDGRRRLPGQEYDCTSEDDPDEMYKDGVCMCTGCGSDCDGCAYYGDDAEAVEEEEEEAVEEEVVEEEAADEVAEEAADAGAEGGDYVVQSSYLETTTSSSGTAASAADGASSSGTTRSSAAEKALHSFFAMMVGCAIAALVVAHSVSLTCSPFA